jgi:hypothetical protein
MKKHVYLFVIASLAVLGVASYVVGYSGPAPKVVVEGNYIEAPGGEDSLGAFPGPDIYQDIVFHGAVEQNGYNCKVVQGTFADATTTPVALANPFGASSAVVESFVYKVTTAATSTTSVDCGVAATAFTSADNLIDGLSVATSATAYEANDYGTNGRAKKSIDSTEYLTCKITVVTLYDGAILDGGNAFAGSYEAKICQ